jgi:sirohydrochlorin cobaltochelatase
MEMIKSAEAESFVMQAVILVGHGGVPTDFPREVLARLKALEAQRRKAGAPPSAEEGELDATIRNWPRTDATDPYRAGLETLATRLRTRLNGARLGVAYNEFCAPSLEDAVEQLIDEGIVSIAVIPSMLTPGGSHSEIEIPEALTKLRTRFPAVTLQYAWPFDLDAVADMLASHVSRFRIP